MVDVTSIAAAITSFKTLKDIAESMVSLAGTQAFQTKAVEFNWKLMEAQSAVFAVNEERSTLVQRVADLEAKLVSLEAWETDKKRYELKDLRKGFYAFIPKQGMEEGEAAHALCTNCYQRRQKSFLHSNGKAFVDEHVWFCPTCKTNYPCESRNLAEMIAKSRQPSA